MRVCADGKDYEGKHKTPNVISHLLFSAWFCKNAQEAYASCALLLMVETVYFLAAERALEIWSGQLVAFMPQRIP